MKKILSPILLFCSALLLSACMGPKSPQEVTQAFWEAVIANNGEDAAKYSTLNKAEEYDAFAQKWDGFHPSLGKVVIEGEQANVSVKLSSPASSKQNDRKVTTYLVRQDDAWKVDYQRTGELLRGGVLGKLFGDLNKLGNDLSKQLKSSAKEIGTELERMGKELEAMSDSVSEEASAELDKYAEELRQEIDALAESIRRALEDQKRELSSEDRQVLTEVAADLQQQRKGLDQPTVQSISDSSKGVGAAQQRLEAMDSNAVRDYQDQWSEWGKQLEKGMREFLDELSAANNR